LRNVCTAIAKVTDTCSRVRLLLGTNYYLVRKNSEL